MTAYTAEQCRSRITRWAWVVCVSIVAFGWTYGTQTAPGWVRILVACLSSAAMMTGLCKLGHWSAALAITVTVTYEAKRRNHGHWERP